MSVDGWTEPSGHYTSDDLPRFLRLSRLQGCLAAFMRAERLRPEQLTEDLVALVASLKHGVPLPGSPNRID